MRQPTDEEVSINLVSSGRRGPRANPVTEQLRRMTADLTVHPRGFVAEIPADSESQSGVRGAVRREHIRNGGSQRYSTHLLPSGDVLVRRVFSQEQVERLMRTASPSDTMNTSTNQATQGDTIS